MAFEIEDRVSIRLFLGGVEVLFSKINSLNFLHMGSSSKLGVPMIHLSLSDPTEIISNRKLLGEGSSIRVMLSSGVGFKTVKTYLFRLNKHRKLAAAPSTTYEMDGYLDVPAYWIQTALKPRKGSSYQVLSEIAEDCGLEFEGDTTSDEQVWIPGNLKYYAWAKNIAERGYRSETSAMKLCLEMDGTLLYKDVCNLLQADHKVSLISKTPGHILATDFRPDTSAGFNNVRHSYKSAVVYQNILNNQTDFNKYDEEVTVEQHSDEVTFLRNSDISNQVTRGSVRFQPLDFGNVHENYHRAKYQGSRLNGLFSLVGSVVTGDVTDVRVFDNLQMNLSSSSGTEHEKPYSGLYKVGGRVVYVNGSNYYEKFDVLRRAYSTEKFS